MEKSVGAACAGTGARRLRASIFSAYPSILGRRLRRGLDELCFREAPDVAVCEYSPRCKVLLFLELEQQALGCRNGRLYCNEKSCAVSEPGLFATPRVNRAQCQTVLAPIRTTHTCLYLQIVQHRAGVAERSLCEFVKLTRAIALPGTGTCSCTDTLACIAKVIQMHVYVLLQEWLRVSGLALAWSQSRQRCRARDELHARAMQGVFSALPSLPRPAKAHACKHR